MVEQDVEEQTKHHRQNLSHHGCGRRTVDAHRGHPVQTKNQDRVKDNIGDRADPLCNHIVDRVACRLHDPLGCDL